MRNSMESPTGSWWASAASIPDASSTGTAARARARSLPAPMCLSSSTHAAPPDRAGSAAGGAARRALAELATLALLGLALPAHADRQMDPELRAVVQQAIGEARCDPREERFGREVFFKLQEPRLGRIVG